MNNLLPAQDSKKKVTPCFIYTMAIFSALGGFLFGYDTGVVSGAMLMLRDVFALNYGWQELIVSITVAFAWLFSLVAGTMTDTFGRKPVIIVASSIFTGGAIVMGVAMNKEVLLVGRLIVGIGIGLVSMSVPMYIAEISPAYIRGQLVTLNNLFITAGQCAASIVDGIFSSDKLNGWRYMLGIAAVPSVIQFIGFFFLPESPRWLVKKGYNERAISVLKRICSPDANIKEEFEAIRSNYIETEVAVKARGSKSVLLDVLRNSSLRRALLIGCALQMFQQISGINTVMYYSATIIEMSGVKGKSLVIWLAAATATTNFLCAFIGLFLVERIGRRILTLSSLAGVILSLGILGIGFLLADMHSPYLDFQSQLPGNDKCSGFTTCSACIRNPDCGYCFFDQPWGPTNGTCLLTNSERTDMSAYPPCNSSSLEDPITWAKEWCPSSYSWMTILGLMLYLFFFAPGMGPMPWTINSEIFPLWARGTCLSITTSVNWIFNLLVSMTFLTLTQAITKYGAFFLYTGLAFVGWIIFFFTLPETKGKTLEEMEEIFVKPHYVNRKKPPIRDTYNSINDSASDRTAI